MFSYATYAKQLMAFQELLGYWKPFISHLVQILKWLCLHAAFEKVKKAIAKAQTPRGVEPYLHWLVMASTDTGFEWVLWQRQHSKQVSLEFWSQLLKGVEFNCSHLEKDLCAVLSQLESATQKLSVTLRTAILIQRWIIVMANKPNSGSAKLSTLTNWKAYFVASQCLQFQPS